MSKQQQEEIEQLKAKLAKFKIKGSKHLPNGDIVFVYEVLYTHEEQVTDFLAVDKKQDI